MNVYKTIYANFAKWISIKSMLSKLSIESYLINIKNFLYYLESFKMLNLKEINLSLLTKFIHSRGGRLNYSAASVRVRLAAIDLFFSWAMQEGYCHENPVVLYKKNKVKSKSLSERVGQNASIEYLTSNEQKILSKVKPSNDFTDIRNQCILVIILSSALLAEEVISLTIDSVNLKKGYIEIKDDEKKMRIISLNTSIFGNNLQDWLTIRKKTLGKNKLSLFFFNSNLKPLTKRLLHKIVSDSLAKAGIMKTRNGPDMLRQTAIINMFGDGKSLEEVQEITGIKTLARLEVYRSALLTTRR